MQFFNKNRSFGYLRTEFQYRRNKKLSGFNKAVLWLNLLSVIGISFSYCARFIDPANFWYIAFFGISYPIFLIINLVFVVYWTVQFRTYALISIIAIGFGYNSLLSNFQVNFDREKPNRPKIKVMSYNSMLFDLYNWSKNAKSRENIFAMLQEESADILCLQEFYNSEEEKDFHNEIDLLKILPTKNVHAGYTVTEREKDHWGIATFTRFPIVRKGMISFNTNSNNACIYTDVIIDKDTVRIYNLHLASIGFIHKDYKFIHDVVENKETEEVEGSKTILKRLKKAFVIRSQQAALVAEHVAKCKYPVILCGDFNDTPTSFAYRKLKGNLSDAFYESGNGIGKTYAGLFPALRIDYILYSNHFDSYGYYKYPETFTDHYPIVSFLQKK